MSEFRKGNVYIRNEWAGVISENDEGYIFKYNKNYLTSESPSPVSLTIPLREEAYLSKVLFPFFDGLIPEGFLTLLFVIGK